jgi:hypothetical protein
MIYSKQNIKSKTWKVISWIHLILSHISSSIFTTAYPDSDYLSWCMKVEEHLEVIQRKFVRSMLPCTC